MESIGEKIFNLRKEKKVSQEKLAGALGVARFTVSRWETNAAQPTTENIKSLCEFFGVASTYFFDSVEESATAEDKQDFVPTVKGEPKFKVLKIASVVTGMVFLAFLIALCGIGAYITISPSAGGEWGEDIHIVNYEGIVFFVLGTVAVALLITFIVLTVVRFLKLRKSK
ncbi:MAG: helix-turn-helix domain-containing protein [Clostridia bacterium]|nr:helix-turn-helix domain-containing protein [Clostridia bacterium]